MRSRRGVLASVVAIAAAACDRSAPPAEGAGAGGAGRAAAAVPEEEPPVAVNPEAPIQYPPRLYDQRVEGNVVLRLFVDSTGTLLPDSSRVAETSGYPALDSAALSGARKLRFAPARRRGIAVATAFLQPVEFRHPGVGAGSGASATTGKSGPGGTLRRRGDTTTIGGDTAPRRAATGLPPIPAAAPPAPNVTPPRGADTAATRPDTAGTPRDSVPVRRDTSAGPR